GGWRGAGLRGRHRRRAAPLPGRARRGGRVLDGDEPRRPHGARSGELSVGSGGVDRRWSGDPAGEHEALRGQRRLLLAQPRRELPARGAAVRWRGGAPLPERAVLAVPRALPVVPLGPRLSAGDPGWCCPGSPAWDVAVRERGSLQRALSEAAPVERSCPRRRSAAGRTSVEVTRHANMPATTITPKENSMRFWATSSEPKPAMVVTAPM